MECGQEFKMLSANHLATHGLNSKSYRQKYGLATRQPLCSDNWAGMTLCHKVLDYLWHMVLPVLSSTVGSLALMTLLGFPDQ